MTPPHRRLQQLLPWPCDTHQKSAVRRLQSHQVLGIHTHRRAADRCRELHLGAMLPQGLSNLIRLMLTTICYVSETARNKRAVAMSVALSHTFKAMLEHGIHPSPPPLAPCIVLHDSNMHCHVALSRLCHCKATCRPHILWYLRCNVDGYLHSSMMYE